MEKIEQHSDTSFFAFLSFYAVHAQNSHTFHPELSEDHLNILWVDLEDTNLWILETDDQGRLSESDMSLKAGLYSRDGEGRIRLCTF